MALVLSRSCVRGDISTKTQYPCSHQPQRPSARPAVAAAACSSWLQAIACGLGVYVALAVLASQPAQAASDEYRLAVFELESDALHDQFADGIAARVRSALDARSDYALHQTRVSLTQLSLAQDCNTNDAACLGAIARSLGIDGFLFGKITHDGGAPAVVLRRYDLWSASVDRSALASFNSTSPQADELDHAATRLLEDLLGPEPTQLSTVPTPSGILPAPVAPPQLERPAVLETRESTSLSPSRIAGFALLGGAVLSTGLSVLSFAFVARAERSRDYERYRLAVGQRSMNVRDVCDEADGGRRYGVDAATFREAKNACSRGTTFEILQFVFIGSAVVSGGLAAYFLTSAGGGARERPSLGNRTFSLHPSLARRGFAVNTRIKF